MQLSMVPSIYFPIGILPNLVVQNVVKIDTITLEKFCFKWIQKNVTGKNIRDAVGNSWKKLQQVLGKIHSMAPID